MGELIQITTQPMVVIDRETHLPIVNEVPQFPVERIPEVMAAAMALNYEPDPLQLKDPVEEENKLARYTNGEVMAIRLVQQAAKGDISAIERIFDRFLGKPRQSVQSVSTTLSYEQFLEAMAMQHNHPKPVEGEG